MRLSFLIPILVVLGMGCVVREPAYTTGYVAYADYPVYYSDGYYYSYYGGGWYLWSHDRWVVSHYYPRAPVRLTNNHGYHRPPGVAPGMQVRDHRNGGSRYHRAPRVQKQPAPATRTTRSRGVTIRDHRRR
jgi:hypothetical protein